MDVKQPNLVIVSPLIVYSERLDASRPTLKEWESLESRREQFSLTMLYNVLKQNIYLPPEYIPEFHLQTSQYHLQTRSCHMFKLMEPFCNTDTYKYSFIPFTSRQWNLLPNYIFESNTIDEFKLMLCNYYFAINS